MEKRAKWWKGHSHITDLHWQWPGTIVKHEDNKTSIQDFIARTSQRSDACLAAEQLERLVHIELRDLATHEAYLHADWPDVKYSDVPRKSKACYTPCIKCSNRPAVGNLLKLIKCQVQRNTGRYSHSEESRKVVTWVRNGRILLNL